MTVNSISRLTLRFQDFSRASSHLTRALALNVKQVAVPGAGGATAAARGWHHKWMTLNPRQSLGPCRLHTEGPGARGKARQWIQLSEACQGPGTSPATSPGGRPVLGATGATGAEGRWRETASTVVEVSTSEPRNQAATPAPEAPFCGSIRHPMAPAPRDPQPGPPWRPRKGGAGGVCKVETEAGRAVGPAMEPRPGPTASPLLQPLSASALEGFRDTLQNLHAFSTGVSTPRIPSF